MAHRLRLLVVAALLLASAGPVGRSAAQELQPPSMADFPPYETSVFSLRSGLASKLADRLLREDPLNVATVQALVSAWRQEEAVRTASRIVDEHPERMAQALAKVASLVPPPSGWMPGSEERMQAMLRQARAKLPALERAGRAEAAYAIARAESSLFHGARRDDAFAASLESIAAQYPGTPTALEVEVDLTERAFYQSRSGATRHYQELLAFARANPGTTAGAKALYFAGFHLANHADLLGLAPEGGGEDPTGRILRLLDLVRELQDGRYPRCEWTEKGDDLITGFFVSEPRYSTRNLDRLLLSYASFIAEHWKLADEPEPARYGIGYLVTNRMAELYAFKGDAIGGVDRFLADLESKVPDRFAVRYLRALYCFGAAKDALPTVRNAGLIDKARQLLKSIHEQADGLYKRKALATLAARAFYERDWSTARTAFEQYVREFPDSPYASIAELRIGQCREQMGDWRAALAAYRSVTGTRDLAVSRVLADVFAARAHEALGEFAEALTLFRRAADRWDPAFGQLYDISSPHPPLAGEPSAIDAGTNTRVPRAAIERRVAELQRTMTAPGGPSPEHARWLLERNRWQEAAQAAAGTASEFPNSRNAVEARYLNHRARLEEALDRADLEKAGADRALATAILDRLACEPFDFAVAVANIARAYLASGSPSAPDVEKQLLATLATLRSAQPPIPTLSALERDVADIRSLILRPNGDTVFAGTKWNGFAWPPRPSPFVVTKLEVQVRLADGQVTRLSFPQRFPHLDNVLFVDEEQIGILTTLMNRLGGTKARGAGIVPDRAVMEAPNQPAGPSLSLMAFLSKGFPVIPGHWGGWHFDTYPTIDRVVFLDDVRTRALVETIVGYAGANVLLEKRGGEWRVTKLTQTWIM